MYHAHFSYFTDTFNAQTKAALTVDLQLLAKTSCSLLTVLSTF